RAHGPVTACMTTGQAAKGFPGNELPAGWDGARQLRAAKATLAGACLLRTSRGNRMKTLGDVFDDQCRRAPDVPAVVSGATRLTFADLHRWSAQLSLTMAPHVSPGH